MSIEMTLAEMAKWFAIGLPLGYIVSALVRRERR